MKSMVVLKIVRKWFENLRFGNRVCRRHFQIFYYLHPVTGIRHRAKVCRNNVKQSFTNSFVLYCRRSEIYVSARECVCVCVCVYTQYDQVN